jgi:hypothetical protein
MSRARAWGLRAALHSMVAEMGVCPQAPTDAATCQLLYSPHHGAGGLYAGAPTRSTLDQHTVGPPAPLGPGQGLGLGLSGEDDAHLCNFLGFDVDDPVDG